jgi:pyruvate dehydrogenase E2 component (dihydrolipoamide acetyltransferase)
MPRLGWDMQVGRLAEWLKHDGDQVAVGDAICTIEGDKATSELESLDSGVLRIPPDSPPPGEEVPVGTLLAYLVAPGEEVPFAAPAGTPTAAPAGPLPSISAAAVPPGVATPTTSADASSGRLLDAPAEDVTTTPGQVPTRGPVPPDVTGDEPPFGQRPPRARRQVASPRARRAATDLGVDVRTLMGSGRSGRILERDVRAAAARSVDTGAVAVAGAPSSAQIGAGGARPADGQDAAAYAGEDETAQPLSQIRRITAARMAESARTVAPVTLTTEADATRLVELRTQIRADIDALGIVAPPLSYNELLVKLLAVALAEQPALNASWRDGRVVEHPDVNIGVAVDTERGLLVPVVRDARTKSLSSISRELQTLISAAQAGALSVEQLEGGTFTLSNLGMYDIDAFTPIVNLPECAILGVGRIVARPVVVDVQAETVRVRRMLALSLTVDHRVVDGGPAARFLQRVKQLVEHPGAWVTR